MALASAKLMRLVGSGRFALSGVKTILAPVVVGGQIQRANLTSLKHGYYEVPETAKPWPYETLPYNAFWQFFDSTRKRFHDNSRLVVIEGNIAVGKEEFAKKFADEFGMKYYPKLAVDDSFITDTGFDLRRMDPWLPPHLKHVDLKTFYSEPDKEKTKYFARTQVKMFTRKYLRCVKALSHLLNTGQGVVMTSSVYSDLAWAKTLLDTGHFSRAAYNYYKVFTANCVIDLWRPHLIIYMDASIPYIRQQINKRNNPIEVNSPVLTDKYLEALDTSFKEVFLEKYEDVSEIIMLEAEGETEWDFLVEDCEAMPLLCGADERPKMFKDWNHELEEEYNMYRMKLASRYQMTRHFYQRLPWDAPELMLYGDDEDIYNEVMEQFNEAIYHKQYNPDNGNSYLFKF